MSTTNEQSGVGDLAVEVLNALHWDLAVPRHRVHARCEKGWVTLTGEVERDYQRSLAEVDARRVRGVVGVTNAITVVGVANAITVAATTATADESRRGGAGAGAA